MPSHRRPLAELKRRYLDEGLPLTAAAEEELRSDPRAGARSILQSIERRRTEARAEGQRLRTMLRYERALWSEGFQRVAGVDEAGMSPLAGPVVAAAVILPEGCRIPGVDDSKKLDASTRERLADEIRKRAVAWGIGAVEPEEIDRINIYRAGLLAMFRAVRALGAVPEALLVDARRIPELPMRQEAIVKGDAKSLSIAAASILAKTDRDARMVVLDRTFPGYGFAKHKGYPVAEHVRALEKLGVSPVHRRSFAPVRKVLGLEPDQGVLFGAARRSS
ncbi:ribonuclease HII [Vulgatibacter incomptus]|uniref:Ribonuclease HII n=1 Tax=Vulgatibacter incomptus TaxID=1391653 RepID=A0A0K1P974_9BACT|nr:ribonuclease HII [Vulgatibacter incomptus]AKU90057.1 Ribonuclease HII [Vulgatibacter incomptus]